MKRMQWVFWISTGLLSLLMVMSTGMYFFKTAEVQQTFETLGFPAYIVIPLAIVKLLGIAAIWLSKSNSLKEWAYAGFFFNFVLALTAHVMIGDGEFGGAAMAIVLLMTSYYSAKQLIANS